MTVYFGSSEDIDFVMSSTITPDTTAGRYDSNYARAGLSIQDNENAIAKWGTGLSTVYVTWRIYPRHTNNVRHFFYFMEDGIQVLRLTAQSGTAVELYTKDGTGAWVLRGTSGGGVVTADVLHKLTVKLVLHATNGEAELWLEDTQQIAYSGDTLGNTGAVGINEAFFSSTARDGATGAGEESIVSEVVVADENTINMRIATLVPNGDGTNTAWTGGFADVDELAENETDVISSASVNEVETMALSDYGGSTVIEPVTVIVSARARKGDSGPQNLQLAVRSGTTEDFSANLNPTNVFATHRIRWDANPDTSSPWTLSEIDSLEAGVKSIA